VWAIDGVRAPLILRKTGWLQYRVVSECYLWAALELDCWNPDSKKGLWGDNVDSHSRVRRVARLARVTVERQCDEDGGRRMATAFGFQFGNERFERADCEVDGGEKKQDHGQPGLFYVAANLW
jgi:hypothetical protein